MVSIHYLAQGAATAERNRQRIRRTGLTPSGHQLWTKKEDDRLRALHGTKLLREIAVDIGRSFYAVRSRAQSLGLAPKRHIWTGAEVSRLRRMYVGGESSESLAEAFPHANILNIRAIANLHRIYRTRRPFSPTGFPLLDQVRARAFDLGYTMSDLDELTELGSYFAQVQWHKSGLNLRAIALAIEAMDGSLMAQWNDPEVGDARLRA